MNTKYTQPSFTTKAFHCPICGVYSKQEWKKLSKARTVHEVYEENLSDSLFLKSNWDKPFYVSICDHCNEESVWYKKNLIYPLNGNSPPPHVDMPEKIKSLYLEASAIVVPSPKGASALLRLTLEELMISLGAKGKSIDAKIGYLVEQGLRKEIQQAMDIVRIVGNGAVHPGTINLDDDTEMANRLFGLINLIVESMITQPKEIEGMYKTLPKKKILGIEQRDKKKK